MQSVLFLCILLLAATEWGSIATEVDVINVMVGDEVYFPFSVQRDLTDDTQLIKIIVEPDKSSSKRYSYQYLFTPEAGGDSKFNRDGFFFNEQNEVMVMKGATKRDTGNYEFILWSGRDDESKKTVKSRLVVHNVPLMWFEQLNPTINVTNDLITVATCIVWADPELEVHWKTTSGLQYNEDLNIEKYRHHNQYTLDLMIVPTDEYNGQVFSCVMTYPYYTTSGKEEIDLSLDVHLNVLYPPKDPIITATDDNTTLTCSADGNPIPYLLWKHNSKVIAGGPSPLDIEVKFSENPLIGSEEYECFVSIASGEPTRKHTIFKLEKTEMEQAKTGKKLAQAEWKQKKQEWKRKKQEWIQQKQQWNLKKQEWNLKKQEWNQLKQQ